MPSHPKSDSVDKIKLGLQADCSMHLLGFLYVNISINIYFEHSHTFEHSHNATEAQT